MTYRAAGLLVAWLVCFAGPSAAVAACPGDDSGLSLPPGFCAVVFADDLGHVRHLAVSPSGVLYANTWSGRYYLGLPTPGGGFLIALRPDASGKAVDIRRFGETPKTGSGGTGVALREGWLYAESGDSIVRYRLRPDSIVPNDKPQVVVSGLPLGGDHPMHPFAIDTDGSLYVDVASATNSCQVKNRTLESHGTEPCTELETRGGIWRFDADKTGQSFSPRERFATGLRNGEGIAIDRAGHRLFVTQHGRDQLHANWPSLYQQEEEATLPAEEVLPLTAGADYGWPECYYDAGRKRLVLAPEYGGDGGNKIGPCATKIAPLAAYPAHWAPNDMVYNERADFPARYRKGLFIAFHGSWDRAPYAQQGYNVIFQSLEGDTAGACEIFADGFAGAVKTPGGALHRPSGLAVGPGGILYVSDDVRGRIYRISYRGDAEQTGGTTVHVTPCPAAAAAAGPVSVATAKPPEGTNPDAGANLPVPAGADVQMVALGNRIFHGEVGGAACTGCHGTDGAGTPLGPNLSDTEWLWSDGSVDGIAATIRGGVAQPKQYRQPMPAMGGGRLSDDEVKALAAYVWGLSRRR